MSTTENDKRRLLELIRQEAANFSDRGGLDRALANAYARGMIRTAFALGALTEAEAQSLNEEVDAVARAGDVAQLKA